MPLANTIALLKHRSPFYILLSLAVFYFPMRMQAQENSPYSRYGLGNATPNSNVVNRGMGGITAAYSDPLSVNFSNPASYTRFQSITEAISGRQYGRVLFDVGISIESKTLREPGNIQKFTGSNGSFSHVQIGVPLRKGWGMSFGLRQLGRISYKVGSNSMLTDPVTGSIIDSAYTEYNGSGGTYLPNIGTGVAIKNLSLGVTMGYLFGRRDWSTTRTIINDSLVFRPSVYESDATYGSLFFTGGAQYRIKMGSKSVLTLGLSGNLKQDLRARNTITRAVYLPEKTDTVSIQDNIRGTIVYPASYTAGLLLERQMGNTGSFMLGADVQRTQWNSFRYFGAADSVQNNWQMHIGTQLRPDAKAGSGYFSNVTYRAGFYFGPDAIHVGRKLPVYGVSLGMGLPLANYNRLSPGQFTIVNLGFEYDKRGNNDNVLTENTFRISIGLNLSDLWFNKRRYE